ncbi:MAG: isopentenyl-diphosphate delta-isomerase [Saprospiraceae bacterium]|nr:isopentenyl-diphosphate delta-isomerase [Saprospiraceae bacterium]
MTSKPIDTNILKQSVDPNDPTAETRKKDHIELAFKSQVGQDTLDSRFYYEPLLSAHPAQGSLESLSFLGKSLRAPVWVSSMTGGTDWANTINHNLAKACGQFGMGMGLGSCRSLLSSNEYLPDFDVRDEIGEALPLFANLGVAQVEELIESGQLSKINELLDKLRADGLIIHVNPFQEWLQPEGDRFKYPPIETIARVLDQLDIQLIVKEVGQGMGRNSLEALLQMPLAAIDFAASGGTNFAKLELLRSEEEKQRIFRELAMIGHSAAEMVQMVNELKDSLGEKVACHQIIISGGVKSFLDGYYLTEKINFPAVYGQASAFLKHARGSYEELEKHVASQIRGLELANAYLKVK